MLRGLYLKTISQVFGSRSSVNAVVHCRKSHLACLVRGFIFGCYQTQFITSTRIRIVKHKVHTQAQTDLAPTNILHICIFEYTCHIRHLSFRISFNSIGKAIWNIIKAIEFKSFLASSLL